MMRGVFTSFVGLASVRKGCNRAGQYRTTIALIHKHGICAQAGVILGLEADSKEVFASTLRACEALGIDGVTASLLTPLPGAPFYEEMKRESRRRSRYWSWYTGTSSVAFAPKQMTAEELFAGYLWFRRRFYSFPSIFRRMAVSRTSRAHPVLVNMGYTLSL